MFSFTITRSHLSKEIIFRFTEIISHHSTRTDLGVLGFDFTIDLTNTATFRESFSGNVRDVRIIDEAVVLVNEAVDGGSKVGDEEGAVEQVLEHSVVFEDGGEEALEVVLGFDFRCGALALAEGGDGGDVLFPNFFCDEGRIDDEVVESIPQ